MEKMSFNEDIDNLIDEFMGTTLLRSTCQFYRKKDGKIKPYGSGVFLKLNSGYFILTASHVVENHVEENPLLIKNKTGYISAAGEPKSTVMNNGDGIDLAYIKLVSEVVEELKGIYSFIGLDDFRDHYNYFDAAQYCVFGFPEESKMKVGEKIVSVAQGYLLNMSKKKVLDYYKLDPLGYFSLEYKGKGVDIRDGSKKKTIKEPYGLSGCGLWLLIPSKDPTNETYKIEGKLIGIMTEFKKGKYHCLVGNKINIVIKALSDFEGLKYKSTKVFY